MVLFMTQNSHHRQVVLDTETTGLDPNSGHRMIEIGCVEIIDRRVTGKELHFYFNMDKKIDAGAVAVHGITNDFLKDKPLFSDKVDEVIEFLRNSELIIHNAPFDVGFINSELSLLPKNNDFYNTKITDYASVLDTLVMAKKKYPRQRNSLDALCKRHKIDNSNRSLHGALLDSHLLAQVYLSMTGGQLGLFDSILSSNSNSNSLSEQITKDTKKVNKNISDKVFSDFKLSNLKRIKVTQDSDEKHNLHLEKILKENKLSKEDLNW